MAIIAIGDPSIQATRSSQLTNKSFDENGSSVIELASSAGIEVDKRCGLSELVVDLGSFPATPKPKNALYITGLASQYPPFTVKPEQFESFVRKNYEAEIPE